MEEKIENDLLYVCTLIEYVARKTCNHRKYIVEKMGEKLIRYHIEYADVNHCLSMEQVSEELIEDAKIEKGDFDTVKECIYSVPSVSAIGKVYQRLVWGLKKEGSFSELIYRVFSSFLSDRISDFNCSV